MDMFPATQGLGESAHAELAQQAQRRAGELAASVEAAELYLAEGKEIPEAVLADVTEYRLVSRWLAKSPTARQNEHRARRQQVRQFTRGLRLAANSAAAPVAESPERVA